jgi:hypothetical protein
MAMIAWIFGILGGLCTVMGIITATEVVSIFDKLPASFTAMFWLVLSVVLFLICIAASLHHGESE